MKQAMLCIASAALVLAGASATATKVTPVQKVIELMEGMLNKGKEEKHAEQVQYAAYKQFCDDTSVEKKRAIAEAEEQITVLKADIEKYTADAAKLAKEISGHNEDVAVWTGDLKAATKVRNLEKADYDKLHEDYSESIDALQRAIQVLKETSADVPQETSFAQLSAVSRLRLVSDEARRTIEEFLAQEQPEGLAVSSPGAYGYEFQSHGVIEMLEKLLDQFVSKRTELEKEESNAAHAFEMLSQDLRAQTEQAEEDSREKSGTRAKKLQAKAEAEADLKGTTTTKEADEKYLSDLTATCEKKATDFESRQALRADELAAITKAIEIISSDDVSGNAGKYLPTLLQGGSSLAALRSEMQSGAQLRAARFLEGRARTLESRVLSAAAGRMADDPFVKVRKMIKDLLVRLMEEANEEAEHKGWCDTELATNEQTRKEKTEAVEILHSEIDQLEASIAKLTEDIAELAKGVADLDAEMAKRTQLRQDESAENKQTIVDAQAAQTAVAQAINVLKEFYEKAADATALVQQQPAAPEIFSSPYKGMQSENGGVVGMLEVIESDFARLEADTQSQELTDQKDYDIFMTDSQVNKAAKTKDMEHRTAKKQDQSQALVTKNDDLEGTQKELDAALTYFDKLKPSCVDAGVSYEDRVGRRKQEIDSLQEALRILNGEDIP